MSRIKIDKPRGLLNSRPDGVVSHHARYHPSPGLQFFVEHYWVVQWDLRGREPYLQETLPHPSVHVVFGQGDSRIVGIGSGKFSVLLKDKGGVFGIKFLPGAFYPFLKSPVSRITDKVLGIDEVFNVDARLLEKAIMSQHDDWKMIEIAEDFLRRRLPERDENVPEVRRIVDFIINDPEITRVDDVARR